MSVHLLLRISTSPGAAFVGVSHVCGASEIRILTLQFMTVRKETAEALSLCA